MDIKLNDSVIDKILELKHLCCKVSPDGDIIDQLVDQKNKNDFNDRIDNFIKIVHDNRDKMTKPFTMEFLINLLSSYLLNQNVNCIPIVNLLYDINRHFYDKIEHINILDIDIDDCK